MGCHENRRIKLYRGVWCVVWSEGRHTRRISLRTSDRGEAERNYEEFIRQADGRPKDIAEILDAWAIEKSSLKSMPTAKGRFKILKGFWGNLMPHHITREKCRAYAARRGVSNTTIKNEMAVLRCAVNWFDPRNEASFEFPPSDPPKDHFLTRDEFLRLLNEVKSPHLWLFMMIALHTGARSTAILELTWDRVDLDRGLINFAKGDHKNKRRSLVPMNDTLLPVIKEAYLARTCDFVVEVAGRGVKSVRKGFGETAKRCGVECSAHVLRHTAAVIMAEAGVAFQEIEQFLGHSGRTTTTRIYASYSPGYLKGAANALHLWYCGSNEPTKHGFKKF